MVQYNASIKYFCSRFLKTCIEILSLQLFLACVYIPFLASYGIAWPLVSLVSTPLCGPFFTLFLGLSIANFIISFLGYHVWLITSMLNQLSDVWMFVLRIPVLYEVGFCKPPLLVLIMMPCLAFGILLYTRMHINRVMLLGLLLFSFYGITRLCSYPFCRFPLEKNNNISVLVVQSKVIVFDKSLDNTLRINQSWITYTLMPFVIRYTGKTSIDYWVVTKPRKRFSSFVEKLMIEMPSITVVTNDQNYNQIYNVQRVIPYRLIDKKFIFDTMEIDTDSIDI